MDYDRLKFRTNPFKILESMGFSYRLKECQTSKTVTLYCAEEFRDEAVTAISGVLTGHWVCAWEAI